MPETQTLIIGDDTTFVAHAVSSLSSRGMSVVSADSNKAAINIVENRRIDLVVLKLNPTKKDTQEIMAELNRLHQRYVTITQGGTEVAAVEEIERAIHNARRRVLKTIHWLDIVSVCLVALIIIAIAIFSQTPLARFFGVFWITALTIEFAHLMIVSRRVQ